MYPNPVLLEQLVRDREEEAQRFAAGAFGPGRRSRPTLRRLATILALVVLLGTVAASLLDLAG